MTHRATTARLEPGEDSVDRATPTERTLGGKTMIALDWSVRLHDGRVLRRRSKGATAAIARRRARAKAEALLAAAEPESAKLRRLADEIAELPPHQREALRRMVAKASS